MDVQIRYPKQKKATSCRIRSAPDSTEPSELYGWNSVLCSDGERRATLISEEEVEGAFAGSGFVPVFTIRVWDYFRNERVEISGVLRETDQDDRVFQALPDQSWQLPDWTTEMLRDVYGIVVDGYGIHDHGFIYHTVR